MIVLKFGGTSVGSAEWMDTAISITEEQISRAPVLVSSAMSGVTNKLMLISAESEKGNYDAAKRHFEEIKSTHIAAIEDFLEGDIAIRATKQVDEIFHEQESLIKGLCLLRECTTRSIDALVSCGELLSTTLLYYRMKQRGIDAVFLDSRDMFITDNTFTNANVDMSMTMKNIAATIKPEPGRIYVAQGFIARTTAGITSTLGRGGSDYSAAIIGAALRADEIQIWTDVCGIMTTDPRIVDNVTTIPEISYEEAAELAFFGAKVVHPSTIQPAVKRAIPVMVKNSRDPGHPGTAIKKNVEGKGLRAIACKKDITVVTIVSSRMLNTYGFLSRIFSIFEKYRTPVDLIATSEVSVSMTIDIDNNLNDIIQELSELGEVSIDSDQSIICMVGPHLWKDTSFLSKAFAAMKGVPIRLITVGSSEINLSMVVSNKNANTVIKYLHTAFLE